MRGRTRFAVLSIGIVGMALLARCAVNTAAPEPVRQLPRLAPCPNSPNCVSTLADVTDAEHAIAPILYTGSAAAAKARLLQVVTAMPRTKLITDDGDYLHWEFRSLLFRFVDDVEFQIDDAAKTIHFRSASRLGQGDLGANRTRMEDVRTRFAEGL